MRVCKLFYTDTHNRNGFREIGFVVEEMEYFYEESLRSGQSL